MFLVISINGLFLVNDLIFQLEFVVSDKLRYIAVFETHYYKRLLSYKTLRNTQHATYHILLTRKIPEIEEEHLLL